MLAAPLRALRLVLPAALCLALAGPDAWAQGTAPAWTPSIVSTPAGLSDGDWREVRDVWQSSRHAAFRTAGGHRARHPGMGWTTDFDGRGFTTTPQSGDWRWGLELVAYGRPGALASVAQPVSVHAEGGRVSYDWDAQLTEWFVNDTRGLEHGYTVHSRPSGGGALTLDLAVRGDLDPRISSNGRDVAFVDDAGDRALDYAGLIVLDADGVALHAGFTPGPDGLRLTVDDATARYPLLIDPIAQDVYIKAFNTGENDRFGMSVALDGHTLVVGAPGEGSANGDPNNNGAPGRGAVYVFVRDGATWSQQAYLKASATFLISGFGTCVDISGNTIVAGAPNSGGAAYVFVRNGTTWSQEAQLTSPAFTSAFGSSVAISGETLVVGSTGGWVSTTQPGNAHVYTRQLSAWSLQQSLAPAAGDVFDFFGTSVSIWGDTVAVGASHEDSGATGVNGDPSDDSVSAAGAVYIFARQGASWSQQAYLKPSVSVASAEFGFSVAGSGETVVVGAPKSGGGSATVFVRDGTTWSQQALLESEHPDVSDWFGLSVAISGDTVAVGAPSEDSAATGVNGDQTDNDASNSGATFVFVRGGTTWHAVAYLKASNTGAGDGFGNAVALSQEAAFVGAWMETSSATGLNGDQSLNVMGQAGAVYAFDLRPWTDLGSALAGSFGEPHLLGFGPLVPDTANSVELAKAKDFALAAMFFSFDVNPVGFKGGTLMTFPFIGEPIFTTTDANGEVPIPFVMPDNVPGAVKFFIQWGIQDAGAIQGVSLSNALLGETP